MATSAPGTSNGADYVNQQPAPSAEPSYKKFTEQSGTEEWSSGIFDCLTAPDNLCLKTCFCPCFVYGKTQARIRDPTLEGYERVNNDCLMWAGANCIGLSFVLSFLARREIRAKYAIKGDDLTDGLLSLCCHCCSLIQVEKEVIGRASGSYTPAKEGYVAPQGMEATPQQ